MMTTKPNGLFAFRRLSAVFIFCLAPSYGHAHISAVAVDCSVPAAFENFVPNAGWTIVDGDDQKRKTFTAFSWSSDDDLSWYEKGVALTDKEYHTLEVENHLAGYTKGPTAYATAHYDLYSALPCNYMDVSIGDAFQNGDDTDYNVAVGSACARYLEPGKLYYTYVELEPSNSSEGTFARVRFQRGRWRNAFQNILFANVAFDCWKQERSVNEDQVRYPDAGKCVFPCHDHPSVSFDTITGEYMNNNPADFPRGNQFPICATWEFDTLNEHVVAPCSESRCENSLDDDYDGYLDCDDPDCEQQCGYMNESMSSMTGDPWLPFPVGTHMGTTSKPGCGHAGKLYHSYDFNVSGTYETDNDLVTVASSNGTVVDVVSHVEGSCYSADINCKTYGYNYGWGNCVILELDGYDGIFERYCHLDSGADAILVEEGQHVCHGTPLGRIGNTGNSSGPHLHWQREDSNGQSVPVARFVELDIPAECGWCNISSNSGPGCYASQNELSCDSGGDEICFGGADEDGDGFIDCEDPDCAEVAECQDCTPEVFSVSPLVAKLGEEKIFTVQGSCLPTSLAFFVENCVDPQPISMSFDISQFACTPSFEIGPQAGVVKDIPGDTGQELFNFTVDYLPMDTVCECNSGSCCDGCNFLSSNVVCGPNADSQYTCSGNGCGDDLTVQYRDQFCSGASGLCDGSLGAWSGPQVAEDCASTELCSAFGQSCNQDQMCCTDNYSITQYACNNFSVAGGGGGGGGQIFRICASVSPQTGMVTVKAQKMDGSNFGNRPYQVRVSGPNDDPCGPNTNFFIQSDTVPESGIGTSELTFVFQSLWGNETSKAYCVTASTVPNDPGYQDIPEQTSWWHSQKSILVKDCI